MTEQQRFAKVGDLILTDEGYAIVIETRGYNDMNPEYRQMLSRYDDYVEYKVAIGKKVGYTNTFLYCFGCNLHRPYFQLGGDDYAQKWIVSSSAYER